MPADRSSPTQMEIPRAKFENSVTYATNSTNLSPGSSSDQSPTEA